MSPLVRHALLLSLFVTFLFAISASASDNDLPVDVERKLAQKFCPSLVLNSGDHNVSPEPVEIMGPIWLWSAFMLADPPYYAGEVLTDNLDHPYWDLNREIQGPIHLSGAETTCGETDFHFYYHFDYAASNPEAHWRIYHNDLEQNYPNPFNPSTTLAFSLKDGSDVHLTIYDVAGRRVRELVNERKERGAYKVVWDGQNDAGETVASGVYFYKLVAGSFTDTKKMTILK
jgi:hypothetical protein